MAPMQLAWAGLQRALHVSGSTCAPALSMPSRRPAPVQPVLQAVLYPWPAHEGAGAVQWFVDPKDWPSEKYPPWAHGAGYVLTKVCRARKLYEVIQQLP